MEYEEKDLIRFPPVDMAKKNVFHVQWGVTFLRRRFKMWHIPEKEMPLKQKESP